MTSSESDGVVVIVLNSDVGLGFSQTLRGKLKQMKNVKYDMTRL